MGEDPKGIAASSGNGFGSCETFTKNLSRRQKENRGCRTSTMGEVPCGEEEGGLDPLEPAARDAAGFLEILPEKLTPRNFVYCEAQSAHNQRQTKDFSSSSGF
jgi:hypothetical protein